MRKQKKTFHLISIISENNVVGVLHWFFFSFFGLSPNDVTNIMGVVQFNFERVSGWSSNVTHSLKWVGIIFEFVFLFSSTCIFLDYFLNMHSILLHSNNFGTLSFVHLVLNHSSAYMVFCLQGCFPKVSKNSVSRGPLYFRNYFAPVCLY